MKIKLPKDSDKRGGQTVIIVKEKKRGLGCGCLVAILLSVGIVWMMYSCHSDMQRTAAQIRAEEAAKTPEQRAAEAIAKPNNIALDFQPSS